ncbi:hypothetical protein TSAR_009701, partial [Trichomalopsis sarcophagae]
FYYVILNFFIIIIVLHDLKCTISSRTVRNEKGPFMCSLKKLRCGTWEEKLFQSAVR